MKQLPNNGGNNADYKPRRSTSFISAIAALVLVGGLIFIIASIVSKAEEAIKTSNLIYGISCIVVSALLFVIVNLSEDVHLLTYIAECNMDSNSFILSHLQKIEDKLYENDGSEEQKNG